MRFQNRTLDRRLTDRLIDHLLDLRIDRPLTTVAPPASSPRPGRGPARRQGRSIAPTVRHLAAALALALPAGVALAQDAAEAQSLRPALVSLVKALLDQGQLSVARARELLRQAGVDPAVLEQPDAPVAAPPAPAPAAAPAPAGAASGTVRVPFLPETLKREIKDDVRKEVIEASRKERWGQPDAFPAWLRRFSFSGDLRLRAQHDAFGEDNALPANLDTYYQRLNATGQATTTNTSEDRTRLRWRARFAIGATVNEATRASLRLVTNSGGDDNDPTSLNVDAGQSNRRIGVALDRLNLAWTQGPWVLNAGRIANPYQTTDLIWSNDLSLDGAAASWLPALTPDLSAFATAGLHPLREINNSPQRRTPDAWLIGLQGGASWRPAAQWELRGALGLFDFRRIEARLNPAGAGDGSTIDYNDAVPQLRQRGNTMFNITAQSNPAAAALWGTASKFRVLDLNAELQAQLEDGWQIGAQLDLLRNIGYDAGEIRARIGSAAAQLPGDTRCGDGEARLACDRTRGYRLEFNIGRGAPDYYGSWRAHAGTRRLERDATFDGFASGDYRLGGTDSLASYLGGSYTIGRNTQLAARYVNARGIDAPAVFRVSTWTVDLNARF
jgi:Putative porin